MRKRFITLIITTVLAAASWAAPSSYPGWEPVKHEVRDARSIVKDDEIEIMTMPACIIINSTRKVNIQVFTILGRLVSSETLQPGVSRLTVGAHGVYIIKVGDLTCKVAI